MFDKLTDKIVCRYFMFYTYIPTCLIVIMSWISFWIKVTYEWKRFKGNVYGKAEKLYTFAIMFLYGRAEQFCTQFHFSKKQCMYMLGLKQQLCIYLKGTAIAKLK